MKKLVYLLTLLIVAFSACDPNEEIYEQLDELKEPYKGSVEYTLTSNDYETLTSLALANASNAEDSTWAEYITEFEAFNDSFPGYDYIPHLLPDLFPAYNNKSVANVTFNYIADIPYELEIYSNAGEIEFSSNFYKAVNENVGVAGYFYPEYNPDLFIPNILKDSISGAVEDEIYIIEYKYSDVDPIFSETYYLVYFDEKFETLTAYEPVSLDNWIVFDEVGTETWEGRKYDDNLYAQFSAYGTEEPSNISWLITPAVDLTEYSEARLNFKSKDGYNNGDPLEVLISTDYTGTGDPNTATWVDLNPTLSTGNSSGYASTWVESGDINIDAYTGGNIYVAFKYTGGDDDITTTMQIDDVTVKVKVDEPIYEVTNEKTPYKKYDIYEYNGSSWIIVDDVYHLNSNDYKAMGEPGENDRFSSDENPRDYLPNLLKAMYPTAGEGVTKILIYDYYTGIEGVLNLADQYTYTNGEWESLYNYIDQTTQQFIYKVTEWKFDPTVIFTMSGSDYQRIVDYVKTNISADYIDSYGTAEYYYGAGSYYSNFDKRISQRLSYEPETFEGLSEEEALELIDQRVQEGIVVLLQNKYPDAVPQVGGEDVHYIVTYETYNNDYSRSYPTVDYQCIQAASGSNPPQFELVEGPYEEE